MLRDRTQTLGGASPPANQNAMPFWTYQHLADVTKGTWLVAPDDLQGELTGLWHDTREIKPGQAYLAIKGENFDGHDFVEQAFDAGASLAIVQANPKSEIRNPKSPILKVDNTVRAIQDLARAYRDELAKGGCKVIGIAGSNGKTSTRHLIHHVLTHAGLKGIQSPKSFNNHLGVPLTLLSGKPQDDFIACEIGTNHPGEIDFLSAIARPDIAVITSIGEEHLEYFKDLDGVAEEELSIAEHLTAQGLVVAGDLGQFDERLRDRGRYRVIRAAASAYRPPANMPLRGKHNQVNARTAACVAEQFGVTAGQCDLAFGSATPEAHRGEMIAFGHDVLVYDDCYNANPSSMRAAIDTLVGIDRPGRHVAILGDMFELGDQADVLHGEVMREARAQVLAVFIGECFRKAARQCDTQHTCLLWTDRTPGDIVALLEPGDTVLLKASRGMRLERLIPAIERRFGPRNEE